MLTEQDIDDADRRPLERLFLQVIMGWLPPEHTRTREQFFIENPTRRYYRPEDYLWFDGARMRMVFLAFDDVHKMARETFSPEEWEAFARSVRESVDVLALDTQGLNQALLRCALKVRLLSQQPDERRPSESPEDPSSSAPVVPKVTKKGAILEHYAHVLKDGPLTCTAIAERITEATGMGIAQPHVYACLVGSGLVKEIRSGPASHETLHLSLLDSPPHP